MTKIGYIHVEKQDIPKPPELTKKQYEELNKYIAECLGGHRCITPQEREVLSVGAPGIAFNALNVPAVEAAVGFAADGSPLARLLAESWLDAADGMTRELVSGIASTNLKQLVNRLG
jgi:hypothetical protein